mmetsp:Transcript_42155/g.98890  ORF Transcript_42155/g.98890 Transcript_42155/m.98890 type:complete len:210 (+) Transcript_42155:3434-4063(+)
MRSHCNRLHPFSATVSGLSPRPARPKVGSSRVYHLGKPAGKQGGVQPCFPGREKSPPRVRSTVHSTPRWQSLPTSSLAAKEEEGGGCPAPSAWRPRPRRSTPPRSSRRRAPAAASHASRGRRGATGQAPTPTPMTTRTTRGQSSALRWLRYRSSSPTRAALRSAAPPQLPSWRTWRRRSATWRSTKSFSTKSTSSNSSRALRGWRPRRG